MKRLGIAVLSAVVLMVLLTSCARVTVTPVAKYDRETPGVRYYESEPYLLVTKNVPKDENTGKAGKATPTYTIQLVWLPNYNLGYAVKTTPGLGKAEGKVKLTDGWQLTEFGAVVDTKIPETIEAVTNLIQALGVSALAKEGMEPVGLTEGLWRLKFNEEKGYVEGVERVL
jgi:nitrogen fixation protein